MLDVSQLGPEKVRPLKRVEYDRLVDAGVFNDERVELLYGTVVEMSPQGAARSAVIWALDRLLQRALGDRAHVRAQFPLAASDGSEPEPDVAVVPPGDYFHGHPSEAYLVIEVADSSLQKDRTIKARLYAEMAVPDYWIVNLLDGVIEIHSEPSGGAYQQVATRGAGDALRVDAFPDVVIAVTDILPPR